MIHFDISFVISIVCPFLSFPFQDQWDVVMWILKYIKKALVKDLIYEDKGNTQIVGYCDAN